MPGFSFPPHGVIVTLYTPSRPIRGEPNPSSCRGSLQIQTCVHVPGGDSR